VAWDRLLAMLPGDLADILERVRRGEFKVKLEHRWLDPLVRLMAQCVLSSALFLGSSHMLSNKAAPTLFDISVPGVMGMAVSVGLLLRMFWVSRRRRDEP
jgi:ubiquinone biosynthesis protein